MNIINPKVLVLELLDIFSRLCIQFSEYMDAVEAKKKKGKHGPLNISITFLELCIEFCHRKTVKGNPPLTLLFSSL